MVRKNLSPAGKSSSNHVPQSAPRRTTPPKTVARLNRKLIIFTVIGLVLGGAGIHGLHAVMVDRNAGGILERADRAEEQGDLAEASRLLSQYLRFRPNDLDALQRHALMVHHPDNPQATARRVSRSIEKILREDPSRSELRKPLSEAAMSLGRFSDAEFHLDELLKDQPDDAGLIRLKALAHAAQSGNTKRREAAELFIAAIALAPKSVDAYAELAALLHADAEALPYWDPVAKRFLPEGRTAAEKENTASARASGGEDSTAVAVDRWAAGADAELLALFPPVQGRANAGDAAQAVLDLMLAKAQPTWKAHEARAQYRQATGDVSGAADDIRHALQSPEAVTDADFLLLAAGVELAQAQATRSDDAAASTEHLDEAMRIAAAGVEPEDGDPRFYGILADVELARGASSELLAAAENHLRDGLARSESLLADAPAHQAGQLQQTTVQLRLSLASLLITRGESDPDRSEATEQAVSQAVNDEIVALRKSGCRPGLIELIECRSLILQRKWDQAARRLESLRPQMINVTEVVRQIDLMLGRCYVALRNPDRRVEVFSRAKVDDPTWVQGRLALANALTEVGRVNDALIEYQSLAGSSGAEGIAGVPIELARLALRRELQKPAADRDFRALDAAVTAAEQQSPDNPLVVAIRVELLAAQGQFDEADALVVRQVEASPESIAAWRTAFDVALARTDWPLEQRISTARQRLEQGEQQFGDRAEIWLARAELTRVAEPENLRETIEGMMKEAETLSPAERRELDRGLIDVARRAGDGEATQQLWQSVVAARPDSLEAWLAIAQGAVESGDPEAIKRAMQAVRRIEGPNGPNGDYLEASRLIARMMREPRPSDDPELREDVETARHLLTQAAQRRTYWSAVPRALGILESRAGNDNAAYESFRKARDLGDTSIEVLRGLITHHGAANRWDLAAAVISETERENPALFRSGELARLKGVVAVKQGDVDGAIAAMNAASFSEDIEGRLTHASLLFMKYQNLTPDERATETGQSVLAEATAGYRRLVEEMPQEPRAWLACVAHLVAIDKRDEARQIVAEAERQLPADPAAERLKVLALCYRAVQETDKATERMRQAVEAAPTDAELRLEAANFFAMTGDLAEAQRQLAWLLNAEHDVPAEILSRARRLQAIATAATGRYEDLRRGITSLAPVAGSEIPIADLRAQVALLARRQTLKDRRELITLLEEIRDRAAMSPETTFANSERFALAALYQQTNQWDKAKPIIEALLQEQPASVDFQTALIMGGLRDRKPTLDEAALETELERRLDRLKALESGTMRLALTIAEFDHRFGRDAEASRTLTDYVASLTNDDSRGGSDVTDEELTELRMIAARAEELKLYDAAEASFRQLTQRSCNSNDALLEAMYLGRRGRYDDALALVEDCPETTAPEAATLAAVSIVSAGRPDDRHMARAEAIVNQSLQSAPASSRLLGLLAGLRMAQGRYDESEALYRRILAENPNDLSVLNNLAWLLVVTGKDPEGAEKLINEAFAIGGPLADLIDTHGVILLALRRPQDAVDAMRDEFENGASPNLALGFHLATAYLALDRTSEARQTFARARELGLGIERLHATEHEAYEELVRRLGAAAGQPPAGN